MRLARLRAPHLVALRGMAEEFRAEGDERFRRVLEDPGGYLESTWRDEISLGLDPSRVGQTHFLLFDGRRPLGGSRLRYRLSPTLLRDGGNLGYEIRRSERGQGHGRAILRLTLEEARVHRGGTFCLPPRLWWSWSPSSHWFRPFWWRRFGVGKLPPKRQPTW